MPADFSDRCDAIEECYEFMLAYAGQGLPSDEGSHAGSQVREFLQRAVNALTGLAESCTRRWPRKGLSLPQNIKLSFQFSNAMPRILSPLSNWCWLSHQSAPS